MSILIGVGSFGLEALLSQGQAIAASNATALAATQTALADAIDAQSSAQALIGSIGSVPVSRSVAGLRLMNVALSDAPTSVTIIDKLRQGTFFLDADDTTTPHDGGLCIVTASGLRYKIDLPTREITPQRFGAYGDGVHDDSAALQAFFNTVGDYTHRIPAGKYLSSTALARINKGSINLFGDGYSKTELIFPNDTDGLSITNGTNEATWGSLKLYGFMVRSTGPKTNRTGLLITSQHLQRPGSSGMNLSVMSQLVGQEWAVGLKVLDTSRSNFSDLYIEGAGRTAMTGIMMTSSPGSPSVSNTFTNFSVSNAKIGFGLPSPGNPGVEGIQISNFVLDAVGQGIVAISSAYGAPFYGITNGHVNTEGGEAIYLDGPQQVDMTGNLFYINADPVTGVVAQRAVYIRKGLFITGSNNKIFTQSPVQHCVELVGEYGGPVYLGIDLVATSGITNGLSVPASYNGVRLSMTRTVTGGGTGGQLVAGSGADKVDYINAYRRDAVIDRAVQVYQGGTGTWKAVSPAEAQAPYSAFVSGNATIDPSLTNYLIVGNGATPITIQLDNTKSVNDQMLYISRYGSSTGAITLQHIVTAGSPIYNEMGVANSTYTMPAGQQWAMLTYHNRQLFVFASPQSGVSSGENTFVGDHLIAAANGRKMGFTGWATGQTLTFSWGQADHYMSAVWGAPLVWSTFHGTIIQNTSGAGSAALRVKGKNSTTNIAEFENSAAVLKAYVQQNGVVRTPHTAGSGAAPTYVAGPGAGISPTITITGTENSHELSITPGASPSSGAILATITVPTTYGSNLRPVFSAANGAAISINICMTGNSTTSYQVYTAIVLTPGVAYKWNVSCQE